MKEMYTKPISEIEKFSVVDILTTVSFTGGTINTDETQGEDL